MREEILIVLAIFAFFTFLVFFSSQESSRVDTLNEAIAILERELAHTQTMLDDAHALIPHMERRVVQVETDYSARELLWTLADILTEQGCEVHIH